MKNILFLLVVISCLFSYGQSKKEINRNLRVQLLEEKTTRILIDSAYNVELARLKSKRKEVRNIERDVLVVEKKEQAYRADIINAHATLNKLGYDANLIVTLARIDSVKAPDFDREFMKKTEMNGESPVLESIDTALNLDGLKIKAQNELLTQKLAEYKRVNEANRKQLEEVQTWISQLNNKRNEYSEVYRKYDWLCVSLKKMTLELEKKITQINRKLEAEERMRLYKEAVAKNKSKKGLPVQFLPPVIIDEEPDVIDHNFENPDFFDPPPPPNYKREMIIESRKPEESIYEYVDEPAQFPGGRAAMIEYLAKNLNYPTTAKEKGVQGKCYVQFIVSRTGIISNVKIKKGIPGCPECDAEAIRVVKAMPNWIPSKINGKEVNFVFNLPVQFKL